jgi:hypothetical protein
MFTFGLGMTESLSPTILASLSNLINYSTLQTVLLDIVKTVDSLSRDVTTIKASVFQLAEDKVNNLPFSRAIYGVFFFGGNIP